MRLLKKFVLPLVLLVAINSSCVTVRHDNGKHKGWFKKPGAAKAKPVKTKGKGPVGKPGSKKLKKK